eukprot:gene8358-14327_t
MDLYFKTVFPTIGGVGVIANTLLIAALYKERKLKRPFQMTILSLAVADLLNCIWLTVAGPVKPPPGHKLQPVYRKVYLAVVALSATTSMLHLMFVTLQRLIAVLLPFRSAQLITQQRCAVVIALIWLTSAAAIWLSYMENIKRMILTYTPALTFICALTLIVSYSFICYRVWLRKRLASTASSSQSEYILLYSILVTVLFIICTFPASVTILYDKKFSESWNDALVIYWLNAVIDPAIYFLFGTLKKKKFRMNKRAAFQNQVKDKPTQ